MGRRPTGTVEPLKGSIRLRFTYLGQRQNETLDLYPSPANLKAAERLLARIQSAITAGVYRRDDFFEDRDGPNGSPTQPFSDFAAAFLATHTGAKSTKRLYQTAFRTTWNPYFGNVALKDLRASDVRKALVERQKQVSNQTLNAHLTALRVCLDRAVEDRLIPENPASAVKNLKVQAPEPEPFTIPERERILAHMHDRYDEQVWNYYTLAFHTGLRPSEQIALRWTDVDWHRRTLKIERAKVDGEEKVTKTNRVRYVDLTDAALAALNRQKAHTFMKQGVVFENPNTRRQWASEHVQRESYFSPTLRALGIQHRNAYQCRHTFATIALMAGVNPAYIATQLGHVDTQMLFKVYAHWITGIDGGAEARKLNSALTGIVHEPASKAE